MIEDYRRGMFLNLAVTVNVLANLDMDSDGGKATIDALVPSLVGVVDWHPGALIPD